MEGKYHSAGSGTFCECDGYFRIVFGAVEKEQYNVQDTQHVNRRHTRAIIEVAIILSKIVW